MILRFLVSPDPLVNELDTKKTFTLLFHTDDETIQLVRHSVDPKSNECRKVLLGRQKIVTGTSNGQPIILRLEDITEKESVHLLGRRLYVVGCDRNTYHCLRAQGLTAPPLITLGNAHLQDQSTFRTSSEESVQDVTSTMDKDFVFTFVGEFVDEVAPTGLTVSAPQVSQILFYPHDSSLEMFVRPYDPNGRRNGRHRYLSRQKVFKEGDSLSKFGIQSFGLHEKPVLNLASSRDSSIAVFDKKPSVSSPLIPLSIHDFILGKTIDIYGRKIRLCDCNKFTMDYFKDNFNITQEPVSFQYLQQRFPPTTMSKYPENELEKQKLPNSIVRKPVQSKLRAEFGNVVLRFEMSLLSDNPQDKDRDFIACVYLIDSSVSVYEVPKLNTGRRCGLFFSRGLVQHENEDRLIEAKDFCIGEVIVLNKHKFRINFADEFTLNFLEGHADEFPQSNYEICISLAKNCLDSPKYHHLKRLINDSSDDQDKTIPQKMAVRLLQRFFVDEEALSEHHHMTIVRHHLIDRPLKIRKGDLSHLASLFIRRVNFSGISDLRWCLRNYDINGSGELTSLEVRRAFIGTKVPLPTILMDELLKSYASPEGLIEYEQLVTDIDPGARVKLFYLPICQLCEGEIKTTLRFERVVDANSLIKSLEV